MFRNLVICMMVIFMLLSCAVPQSQKAEANNTAVEAANPFDGAKPIGVAVAHDPVDTRQYFNYAFDQPAFAKSQYSSHYNLGNLCDGNDATIWGSSTGDREQWIYVNMGTWRPINGVTLKWVNPYYGVDYQVYMSNDLKQWDFITERVGHTGGEDNLFWYTTLHYQFVGVLFTERNSIAYGLKEFEVMGPKFVIDFPDVKLKRKLQVEFSIPVDDIYNCDLVMPYTLDASNANITDLTGIEYCVRMTFLTLTSNAIKDLTPVRSMKELKMLDVTNNNMEIKESTEQGRINLEIINELIANGCSVNWQEGNDTVDP